MPLVTSKTTSVMYNDLYLGSDFIQALDLNQMSIFHLCQCFRTDLCKFWSIKYDAI